MACKSLGIGDKVFALTKAVRPHKKSIYVIAGQKSFPPLQPIVRAPTAAGPRRSRYLPKTARRAPQALEAGAFWDHRPKNPAVPTPPHPCRIKPRPTILFPTPLPVQ